MYRRGSRPSRPACLNAAALATLALVVSAATASAACIDVANPISLVFEGRLTHQILPGPPNWSDVSKGDMAESTFILELTRPTCAKGDEFLEGDVAVDRVQVYSPVETIEATLRGLVGKTVVVVADSAFGAHTRHHRAPLVAEVARVRDLGTAAATTDGSPSAPGSGRAEATVRAFYAALAAADGDAAAGLVVPEKRVRGPFSAAEISRFYGSLAVPLALVSLEREKDGFLVRYGYTATSGKSCDGRARVQTVERDGRQLIATIRALDGC